jgi:hypothetical protein
VAYGLGVVDIVLAVNNFGDTRSGGLAGPAGLFVIVLMSIATVLLIRNMNKRLRRLPDSFPDPRVAEREAEIARLDADLARSGAEPVGRNVDNDRSVASTAAADAEVNGVDTAEQSEPDGSGSARS